MFNVLIRTAILYALVILAMRLMGKRQLGELQPYEFAITMMIADLAALPMQDSRLPLLLGIIPIITLLFLKITISYVQLKFQSSRRIMEGEPCVLICRGKINYNSLKKQQINLDELMEELRLAGYFDISEIEYAILENNGQLSFLTCSNAYAMTQRQQKAQEKELQKKEQQFNEIKNNLTPLEQIQNQIELLKQQQQSSSNSSSSEEGNDKHSSSNCGSKNKSSSGNAAHLNTKQSNTPKPQLPVIYVVDGKVNNNNLTSSKKNKVWIENELKKHKIDSIEKVLIAMTDTSGKFIYQLYDEYVEGEKK